MGVPPMQTTLMSGEIRCILNIHYQNSSALLVLFRMTFVKHNSVTRLQLATRHKACGASLSAMRFDLNDDPACGFADHLADSNAATFGESGVNQFLMIDAIEKPVAEAAGEALRQIQRLFPGKRERTILRHGEIGRAHV